MPDRVFVSSEPPPLDARPPFDPAQLRADFVDLEWWTANTPAFILYAAALAACHGLNPALNAPRFVTSAVTLILEGERICPDHESSPAFVFRTIVEVIAGWAAAAPAADPSPPIAPEPAPPA